MNQELLKSLMKNKTFLIYETEQRNVKIFDVVVNVSMEKQHTKVGGFNVMSSHQSDILEVEFLNDRGVLEILDFFEIRSGKYVKQSLSIFSESKDSTSHCHGCSLHSYSENKFKFYFDYMEVDKRNDLDSIRIYKRNQRLESIGI